MSTHDIGDLVRLAVTFAASDGIGMNPTAVTLTILAPDGTSTTPTPVSDGSGVYHHDLTLTQSGRWDFRWAGTGAVVAAEEGWLNVRAQAPPRTRILTVPELRKHIEYPTGADADAALQLLLDASEEAIVRAAGPAGAVTEFPEGGWSYLVLGRPIAAITTLTVDHDSDTPLVLAADDYRFTPGGWVISRLSDGTNPASTWSGAVRVVYSPVDDAETRKAVQLGLVRLGLSDPGGLTGRTIGDWSETFAADDERAGQRASLLAGLSGGNGMRVI